jgi:hypothetical protein
MNGQLNSSHQRPLLTPILEEERTRALCIRSDEKAKLQKKLEASEVLRICMKGSLGPTLGGLNAAMEVLLVK